MKTRRYEEDIMMHKNTRNVEVIRIVNILKKEYLIEVCEVYQHREHGNSGTSGESYV